MRQLAIRILTVLSVVGGTSAGSITEDLSDWIMGQEPLLVGGSRPDGTDGAYLRLPVGQGSFYYEVQDEGEGAIELYILDNACCLDDPNPGYPAAGPMWGLQTSGYEAMCVGIGRASYVYGCAGYVGWCSVNPYSFVPFNPGVRGADGSAFMSGWYRWTITGRWDSITFTLHDVSFLPDGGVTPEDKVFGDCSVTYDRDSYGGMCGDVFGDGFIALYLRGDGTGGCETIDVHVVGGSGVFEDVSDTPLPVGSGNHNTGWGEIKRLFR